MAASEGTIHPLSIPHPFIHLSSSIHPSTISSIYQTITLSSIIYVTIHSSSIPQSSIYHLSIIHCAFIHHFPSLIHSSFHSSINSSIYASSTHESVIHWSINFTYPFIHPLIHPTIYRFIHPSAIIQLSSIHLQSQPLLPLTVYKLAVVFVPHSLSNTLT